MYFTNRLWHSGGGSILGRITGGRLLGVFHNNCL